MVLLVEPRLTARPVSVNRHGKRWATVHLGLWFLLFVLGLATTVHGDPKQIRLRNGVIVTPEPERSRLAAQSSLPEPVVSGLYLVQFAHRLEPAWRDQLRGAGVQLVRYVPEDAFVVRLTGVRLAQVRALPFVRWVGEYGPDYKVYAGLSQELREAAPNSRVAVSVLVSRDVPRSELAKSGTTFSSLRLRSQTSFGTVLEGEVSMDELAGLAQSEAVLWIEPACRMKLSDEIASKIVAGGEIPRARPSEWEDPLGGLDGAGRHSTITQQLGYDGRGVTVAVADSGLSDGEAATVHPDLSGRVDAFLFYGSLQDAADEHGHGTHVAGIIAGNGAVGETDPLGTLYGLGLAPQAHLVVQRVFDGAGADLRPDYGTLTRDAVRAGAVIGSNSWGDEVQGRYDLGAAQFDALVRDADAETPGEQPYTLVFSAGNAGPASRTLNSPATAKNVIATGACENDRFDFLTYAKGQNTVADFSSRGPCEDGRIKPDVLAPGTWIASLRSSAATDQNGAWAPISDQYQYDGGTSQAGPHVAGAAAVFVQFYRETHTNAAPSPALVKAALIHSAVDMDDSAGTGPVPNSDEGWGRVALTNLIGSLSRVEYVDQTQELSTGQSYEQRVIVASGSQPLKITLAYTDVPGLPAALPALVNDLDLEVVGPNGQIYRGNQFLNGESVEGATASDAINNVEAVRLRQPAPGDYVVRVCARNVVEDVHHEEGVAPRQDFALVISGDLPAPGVGLIVLDRQTYPAPGVIQLKLIDADLAGQPSVNVLLKSSTETEGELATLQASASSGIFTGAVTTATGPPLQDGVLQVAHGDAIEADYQDASPAALRTSGARADLVPPIITHVTVTNRFGKVVVTWQADEAATAVVFYGTNGVLALSATNRVVEAEQQVELSDLAAGVAYEFSVMSIDTAGNRTTDDAGGSFYRFVAQPAAAVLLVNAYVPDDPAYQTTVIPLTAYTDALDQTGVTYDVWDLSRPDSPSPTRDDLRPFPVVIWRLSDSLLGPTTLTPPQQAALESYVNGGGALFVASMELLTSLGENSAFRTNVLHVQAFSKDVGVSQVQGQDSDPISNGMHFTLDYSAYDNAILASLGLSPDVADTLTLDSHAAPLFLDPSLNTVAGMRFPRRGYDTPGRVVFLPFPFDAVPTSGDAPNNRAALLRKVLSFLAPGLGGLGSVRLDRTAYTLPDLITLELADSDLAGQRTASVRCFSSTLTNGMAVTLTESNRRGLFRGSVTVGAVPIKTGPKQLRAQAGDAIWVEYYDASRAELVSDRAVVDVEAPTISIITVTPEYKQATIQWTTSEPTDGLVQFGESTFLGHTAYQESLTTAHELLLPALQPGRTYYYQVVSRDRAGNTAIDNNKGALYTFHTLKPLSSPWSDNLDGPDSATNWSVENRPESITAWTIGTPANGLETEAHSPPQAWGSNLNGAPIDVADTSLIGPGLLLTGGTVATLHFWHSYDFSPVSEGDIYELGRLLVSTNESDHWTLLKEYSDASAGWQEELVDLTPFLGQVVHLAWVYSLFSLEVHSRPGWLLDDVSITVSNIVAGTLQITNDVAQATFTLSGPISRTGQGWITTWTNIPAGEYVVQFNPVPFYQAPPPQTVVLSNRTLVVEGHYSFPDANHNGISDAWEQQSFGSVAAEHPPNTDSDGDGSSDFDEFIAGTNPLDAGSSLQLLPPIKLANGSCRLSWTASPGHAYRLRSSPDAVSWEPMTGWLRASTTRFSYVVPASDLTAPRFFRLEVSP